MPYPLTAKRTHLTRSSTCFSLHLPINLACPKCERSVEKGVDRRKKNNCVRPWDTNIWGSHRELRYVKRYTDVRNFLGLSSEGDLLSNEYMYLSMCSVGSSEAETGIERKDSSESSLTWEQETNETAVLETENNSVIDNTDDTMVSADKNYSDVDATIVSTTTNYCSTDTSTKKREALEMLQKMKEDWLRYKKIRLSIPDSPSNVAMDTLQESIKSLIDSTQPNNISIEEDRGELVDDEEIETRDNK